jgi:hypothetical protein
VRTRKASCKWLDWPTFALGVELREINSTSIWEKFTQSCLCKSPFNPTVISCLYLMDPNTSSPSKWSILGVYEEPRVNMAITIVNCKGLPNWLTLHSHNSSLSSFVLEQPPCKKT